jgi:hypothetical protein
MVLVLLMARVFRVYANAVCHVAALELIHINAT